MHRVRVFDITSGTDLLTLETGPSSIRSFTPDSRYLLTVGDAGLRLWELATGKEVLRQPSLKYLSYYCLAVACDGRSVAVGMPDANVLVWDLAPATRQMIKLSLDDIVRLWKEMSGDDGARAYQAIGTLMADPEHAVPFLSDRLQPVKVDAPRIRRLIADLDSEQFTVRDAAFGELEKMDDGAHAVLRLELPKTTSLEKRRRIQSLLSMRWIVRSQEKLRQIRAVMVLEQVGNEEARRVLGKLANSASEARQTREAKAALERLSEANRWSRQE
jgi:hypothetical protein